MKMDDFAEKICAAVEKRIGKGFHTEVREVMKNNGIILHGLVILSEKQTAVPTIYLEHFLEEYESGMPFEEVVCRLLSVYERDTPHGEVNMNFFSSFEAVADGICYRLIGKLGNESMLEKVPHRDFLDMAVCLYYAYHNEALGEGSIQIYNSHMEMWGTCTEELFRLAQDNTPRLFPWKCSGMEEILNEMAELDADNTGAVPKHEPENAEWKIPMRILSNQKKCNGAACILYPGVLEELAGKRGNLFIIPSSIHETILLPDDETILAGDLKKMIHEVNTTQVSPDEVLSDSLYYYDAVKKEIVMA